MVWEGRRREASPYPDHKILQGTKPADQSGVRRDDRQLLKTEELSKKIRE